MRLMKYMKCYVREISWCFALFLVIALVRVAAIVLRQGLRPMLMRQ